MDFNTQVTDDFIKQVCEGEAWGKANIKVARIEESSEETAEEVAQVSEATEVVEEASEEEVSFSLDDLEYVLDNLEDDALLEHAANMLNIFDEAEAYLLNEGDEDEEEEEEEEEEEKWVRYSP